MTRDLVLGGVLLTISVVYYLGAAAIPDSELGDAVGPAGLPGVYAIVLAASSVLLMARGMRAQRALTVATAEGRTVQPQRAPGRLATLLAIGVLYIAVVPVAGYAPTIAALIVATALYHARSAPSSMPGHGRRQTTAQVLLVGLAGAALLWIVFVVLLRIPQPAGIWPTPW